MSQSDYIKQKKIANIISTKGSGATLNRSDFPQVFDSQVYTDYLQKNAIESVSNTLPTYNQLAVSGTTTIFDMPLQLADCASSGFCFHEDEDDLVRRFNQTEVDTFLDANGVPAVHNVVPYVKDVPVVKTSECLSTVTISKPLISRQGTNILTGGSILSSYGKFITYEWSDGAIYKIKGSRYGVSSVQHRIEIPGNYFFTVSYKCISASSDIITVVQEITNVNIKQNGNILTGSSDLLFSDRSVAYQWYRGNTAISGAASSVYTATSPGSYTVHISSYGVSSTSEPVTLVQEITNVNITRSVNTLTVSTHLLFSDTSVQYQWYKNNIILVGATNSFFNTGGNSGSYFVYISSYGVSTVSSSFTV